MATKKAPKGYSLAEQIAEQRANIVACGRDLDGYIAKYGIKGHPNTLGEGGCAIYAADQCALAVLLRRAAKDCGDIQRRGFLAEAADCEANRRVADIRAGKIAKGPELLEAYLNRPFR